MQHAIAPVSQVSQPRPAALHVRRLYLFPPPTLCRTAWTVRQEYTGNVQGPAEAAEAALSGLAGDQLW